MFDSSAALTSKFRWRIGGTTDRNFKVAALGQIMSARRDRRHHQLRFLSLRVPHNMLGKASPVGISGTRERRLPAFPGP
jgi:hypothetical protein